MQEKIRTIHVYLEGFEEEDQPIIDADSEPTPERTQYTTLGVMCILYLVFLCIGIPIVFSFLPQIYPNTYDISVSKAITLTLSQHPTAMQLKIYAFPQVKKTEQITVAASGSMHENALAATGLITFYNSLYTPQTVEAGTHLTGKSGVTVVTSQTVIVPAATKTSPPTDGTISVTATSTVVGSLGNIEAQDINQVCCGGSILAQNLYAFSGGQDAKDIPVLSKSDVSAGTQQITSQVNGAINDQIQGEIKPGYMLLPLGCKSNLSANHNAGDHAESAIITLTEICTPLAYFAPDVAALAQHFLKIPQGYHVVSLSAYIAKSNLTAIGGTLTVATIAYLKQDRPTTQPYHFNTK